MTNNRHGATGLASRSACHAPLLSPRRLGDVYMPLCMAGTLLHLTLDLSAAAWLARVTLLLFLILQFPRLKTMPKVLLTLCLSGGVLTLLTDGDAGPTLRALDRFCYFATFVSSLGLLRVAALRSPLVRAAGLTLIRQRPAWRYPGLALGTAAFGVVINIGALNLFGSMIQKGNNAGSAGLRAAREKRMMLALLRGFALTPIVSPLSIATVVVLSKMPSLAWRDLAPLAFAAGAVVFLLGWLLDAWQAPPPAPNNEPAPPLQPLWRFCALMLGITALVFLVSALCRVSLPIAVLIACPLAAFVWLSLQLRRLSGGSGTGRALALLSRRAEPIFAGQRGEIVMLGGSAGLGTLLASHIDIQGLEHWLSVSGLHGTLLAVLAMATVLVFSQLGLNPVVSVTVLLSLVPDPMALGMEPRVLAVAMMCAWGLAMMSSPFTTVLLIVAGFARRSPYSLAWRWNGALFALAATACALLLWVAQTLWI